MSKSILISIKPEWVAKIFNGEKTIEIRKTVPKCDLPIDVYIYCTKEKDYLTRGKSGKVYLSCCISNGIKEWHLNGKVVAKFTLKKVEEIICRPICGEWESYTKTLGYSEISQASCLGNREIVHYLKGNNGYAWHIDNLVIFDEPKELKDFHKRFYPQYAGFIKNETHYELEPLTKAPQSWCYVEVDYE